VDVGKITSGELELCREPLDLGELARDAVAALQDPIRRSGSEVVVQVAGTVTGRWDRPSLETAFTQLLSNAVKFGAGKPIEIEVRGSGARVSLTVRDHGMGISAADQARIFQRFERAVSERHFGGFGVGLWIARKATEANGGTLRVESREGQGSEFIVELPRDGAPEADRAPAERSGDLLGSSS
jgi:signal transduction histidine kinase